MQIALHDIRSMGNRNIFNSYGSIVDAIKKLNYEYYNTKCSAYGFLRQWGSIGENISKNIIGLHAFVLMCEPMIDNISFAKDSKDSAPAQRKFRDRWNSLWDNIAKDVSLDSQTVELLGDFGLKLGLLPVNRFSDTIIEFYNALFIWNVFIQSEVNFEYHGMTHIEVLDLMITSGNDFPKKVIEELRD